MRNLVVCCDGTWNTPDQMDHGLPSPTNVVKLSNAIKRNDAQLVYYHPGVGTGKGWWDHVVGGGTGEGLDHNIKSAYAWLARTYKSEDRIFLFGFSRGAYTARSLGGLITGHGLLDAGDIADKPDEVWRNVDKIFSAYRNGHDLEDNADLTFHNAKKGEDPKESTKIHFVGVWDTVGALGIPDDFAFLGLLDRPEKYRFHDTRLSPAILHARHAVALDEKRASFEPTLWSNIAEGQDVKQVWFPGVHGDVGGGYAETGLSDGALEWMLDEAEEEPCGLQIRAGARKQLDIDAHGVLHDSCSGVFKFLKTQPRPTPRVSAAASKDLHSSVQKRCKTPSLMQGAYWPAVKLAKGKSTTFDIFAAKQWNETGLYLEKDTKYAFAAKGQWIDDQDKFYPDGGHDGHIRFGDLARFAGSALGEAEKLFKSVTHDMQADFWLSKRFEDARWFELVGFIANRYGKDARWLPTGQMFKIGKATEVTPKASGYLYCFANDAWQTYGNNRGSVSLTVKRL